MRCVRILHVSARRSKVHGGVRCNCCKNRRQAASDAANSRHNLPKTFVLCPHGQNPFPCTKYVAAVCNYTWRCIKRDSQLDRITIWKPSGKSAFRTYRQFYFLHTKVGICIIIIGNIDLSQRRHFVLEEIRVGGFCRLRLCSKVCTAFYRKLIAELWSVTCCIGSHSVTCNPKTGRT